MKRLSAVTAFVIILSLLFSVPAVANKTEYLPGDFTDIESHWAYDQMSELIAMGIMKGYSQTIYSSELGRNIKVRVAQPAQRITRAEFAAMLYQALNLKPVTETAPFRDEIPFWASEAVNTLYSAGIIKGNPDGTFGSNRSITRAEIAAMLVQALNDKEPRAGKSFSDVPGWHWARPSVQKASALGMINGFPGGRFYPDRKAQRAEVMVMLYQFLLKDRSQAPEDYILLETVKKMLKGMEDGINGTDSVDLTSIAPYVTGEMELLLPDSTRALNDLKTNGTLSYKVNYPGAVASKSDRWAEVVFETAAVFKTSDHSMEQRSREHFYMMKIEDRWYVYSQMDERLLN